MDYAGDSGKHLKMASKLGLFMEEQPPKLYTALHDVYKAFSIATETGYQFCTNVPLSEITNCYNTYYYDGSVTEFIDLFRTCERVRNAKRDTNVDRNKN